MRAALPLLGLAVLLTALPTLGFHESYFKAEGIATQGAQALLATVEYTPIGGGENVFGTFRVTLRDALGSTVVDATFTGVLLQQGLDRDPIPEMFIRTAESSDGQTFSVTGAFAQWEQSPTVFEHVYQGHYLGWTLALDGLQVAGRWA